MEPNPIKYFVLPNFLPSDVNQKLYNYTLRNEAHFLERSQSPGFPPQKSFAAPHGFDSWKSYMVEKLLNSLPSIQSALDMHFVPGKVEADVSAIFNKGFLGLHNDTFCASNRVLTYVYYFNAIPKPFIGGQLCLHGLKESKAIIQPNNNICVLFPAWYNHQVLSVACESFGDGRFSINGWISKTD
ncbi:MAG: 2OG-Fe(II) oxygenase [Planktothrix sp.]